MQMSILYCKYVKYILLYSYKKGGELNPGKVDSPPCHSTLYLKERSMNTLPEIFTPRKNAPVRYANYDGHEGYATVTDDWTVLFRTSGSLWYPALSQADLVILGLVSDAEAQLALDRCAGSYAAIATSRKNVEV
jgi:hypothetical protein